MSLTIENSANYAARIVIVPKAIKVEKSDFLYTLGIQGSTAVVDQSWVEREGELAVLFVAETQISDTYAHANNLYRHSDLNADPTQTGYLEDNRRVRALKLRGVVSQALIMPLISIFDAFKIAPDFKEGDTFDTIDGQEVCRKYVVKEKETQDRVAKQVARAFKRVDTTMLPEHFETEQYLRNEHYLDDDDVLIVTQKLHGTSARFANTIVKRKLKWYERLAVRIGIPVAETEYDTVAGSRRSIKDPHNPDQQHFYAADGTGGDVWTQYLSRVEASIPKGFIVYGEIVGYVSGSDSPIQKGHTYEQEETTNELYVYRVAFVNPDGMLVDLSWDQVRGFCAARSFKWVPELWRGYKKDFDSADFWEKDFKANYWKHLGLAPEPIYPDQPVGLSKGGTGKDEGIAIRVERNGLSPLLFKVKNNSHYLYETEQLDAGVVDTEAAES